MVAVQVLKILGGQLWPANIKRTLFLDASQFHPDHDMVAMFEAALALGDPTEDTDGESTVSVRANVPLIAFRHPERSRTIRQEVIKATERILGHGRSGVAPGAPQGLQIQALVSFTSLRLIALRVLTGLPARRGAFAKTAATCSRCTCIACASGHRIRLALAQQASVVSWPPLHSACMHSERPDNLKGMAVTHHCHTSRSQVQRCYASHSQEHHGARLQTYQMEGFDSNRLIESNLLVRDYTAAARGCTLLLECAWFGELDMFTYRDQPGFPYVMDKLGLWEHVKIADHRDKKHLLRMAQPEGSDATGSDGGAAGDDGNGLLDKSGLRGA